MMMAGVLAPSLFLSAVAAFTVSPTAPTTVERWNRYEVSLTGPSTGNPFVDVTLNATFTLSTSTEDPILESVNTTSNGSANLPKALVALDFAAGDGLSTPNFGTSGGQAQIISAKRSPLVPAGSSGQSLDLGSDVTKRHVVELPGAGQDFTGLAGLEAFTLTGWIQVRGGSEGSGGNRVINYCNGGGGFDLVWDAANGGRLKLAVNEWPDGDHPTSADGSMPASPASWPEWRFFGVTYDANAPNGTDNVRWYFGNSRDAAAPDGRAAFGAYTRGAVKDPQLPLAFGNFGSGFHANDRMLRGMLYAPRIFARALTAVEVVAAQHRAGCAPACGANSCGSDGCGGSCGACGGARVCGARGGGPRTCEMPTSVTVGGFYDGGTDYRVRFAPPFAGSWTYRTASNVAALDGKSGAFVATQPSGANHGPVLSNKYALQFADGTPHFSVGSTSYQWASMPLAMQAQTLRTLREGQGDGPVFNKQRMTVFPKWYRNNHQNPVEVGAAFQIRPGSVAANASAWGCVGTGCPSTSGSFDFSRFNVSYWRNFERLVGEMQQMGVIADVIDGADVADVTAVTGELGQMGAIVDATGATHTSRCLLLRLIAFPLHRQIIVFHPYDDDHWGFDCMGGRTPTAAKPYDTAHDNFYLRYLAARLSSYSNGACAPRRVPIGSSPTSLGPARGATAARQLRRDSGCRSSLRAAVTVCNGV